MVHLHLPIKRIPR